MSAAGDMIADRFRIERQLGAGGMGAVYVATQLPLGRPVALKLIKAVHAGDASAVERFKREAETVARIVNPHVVTLYDFDVNKDGSLFIAMELLKGQDLRHRLKQGALKIDDACAVARDICDGLTAAHAAGVVHRDLKPENVFLVEGMNRAPFAKLLDFGVARQVDVPVGETPDATLTGAGLVVGTPGYIAPDVAMGGPVDGRADLYALGVVMFEMLAGGFPFRESTPAATIVRQLSAPAPRLSSQVDVPPAVDDLVASLLERDPANRPASAAIVGDQLRALLSTSSVPTATATPITPSPVASAVASAIAQETATATTTDIVARAPRPASRTARKTVMTGVALLGAVVAAGVIGVVSAKMLKTPTHREVDAACFHTRRDDVRRQVEGALLAEREGRGIDELGHWTRAVELDDNYAAGHARLVLEHMLADIETARKHRNKALDLRGGLCRRDRALLNAVDELLAPDVDLARYEEKIVALRDEYPDNPMLAMFAANAALFRGKQLDALTQFERAVALDPTNATLLQMKAKAQIAAFEHEPALRTLEQCLALDSAKRGLRCRAQKFYVLASLDRCDEAKTVALELRDYAETGHALANVLIQAGEPVEHAERALTAADKQRAPSTEAALAIWKGDFDRAVEILSNPDLDQDLAPLWLVEIEMERGRVEVANEIATKTLATYATSRLLRDRGAALILEEHLVSVARRDQTEQLRRREAWLERMGPFAGFLVQPVDIWLAAFAAPARDPVSARAVVTTARKVDELKRSVRARAELGRMTLLAGLPATEALKSVALHCNPLEAPIDVIRSRFRLGEALENEGDKEGAKRAYQFVIDRWGATPSVTAAKAKERLEAL